MSGERLQLAASSRLLLLAPVLVMSALVSVLVLIPVRSAQAALPPRLFPVQGAILVHPSAEPDDESHMERVRPSTQRLKWTSLALMADFPLSFGQVVTGAIAVPGQVVTYTFVAGAGDLVLVRLSDNGSFFDPEVRLYAPDSSLLKSNWSSGSYVEITETLYED